MKHNTGENLNDLIDIALDSKESIFIVTNNVNEYITKMNNVNIALLFADDVFYDYKKILNICAAVNSNKNELSEVLLVSKDSSENIDKARAIIRGFNKRLWEKELKK